MKNGKFVGRVPIGYTGERYVYQMVSGETKSKVKRGKGKVSRTSKAYSVFSVCLKSCYLHVGGIYQSNEVASCFCVEAESKTSKFNPSTLPAIQTAKTLAGSKESGFDSEPWA